MTFVRLLRGRTDMVFGVNMMSVSTYDEMDINKSVVTVQQSIDIDLAAMCKTTKAFSIMTSIAACMHISCKIPQRMKIISTEL
jgi:Flp pilus assembly secretin CpaC